MDRHTRFLAAISAAALMAYVVGMAGAAGMAAAGSEAPVTAIVASTDEPLLPADGAAKPDFS